MGSWGPVCEHPGCEQVCACLYSQQGLGAVARDDLCTQRVGGGKGRAPKVIGRGQGQRDPPPEVGVTCGHLSRAEPTALQEAQKTGIGGWGRTQARS